MTIIAFPCAHCAHGIEDHLKELTRLGGIPLLVEAIHSRETTSISTWTHQCSTPGCRCDTYRIDGDKLINAYVSVADKNMPDWLGDGFTVLRFDRTATTVRACMACKGKIPAEESRFIVQVMNLEEYDEEYERSMVNEPEEGDEDFDPDDSIDYEPSTFTPTTMCAACVVTFGDDSLPARVDNF